MSHGQATKAERAAALVESVKAMREKLNETKRESAETLGRAKAMQESMNEMKRETAETLGRAKAMQESMNEMKRETAETLERALALEKLAKALVGPVSALAESRAQDVYMHD
jgi:uncharacterized coiled-coil DUF342 family protein